MNGLDAAAAYDISGAPGELLLALLIAFGLGALFGRAILTPPRLVFKQPRLFSPRQETPKKKTTPSRRDDQVIITPAPRSNS